MLRPRDASPPALKGHTTKRRTHPISYCCTYSPPPNIDLDIPRHPARAAPFWPQTGLLAEPASDGLDDYLTSLCKSAAKEASSTPSSTTQTAPSPTPTEELADVKMVNKKLAVAMIKAQGTIAAMEDELEALRSQGSTVATGDTLPRRREVPSASDQASEFFRLGERYFDEGIAAAKLTTWEFEMAAHMFHYAAAQGHAEARFNLAMMCLKAKYRGVPEDPCKAIGLFEQSAAKGNAPARFALAIMCTEGTSVPQDHARAASLFRAAAAQGHAEAKAHLGHAVSPIDVTVISPALFLPLPLHDTLKKDHLQPSSSILAPSCWHAVPL